MRSKHFSFMLNTTVSLLALGSVLIALPAKAWVTAPDRAMGMPPSVELNLDVLQRLRPPDVASAVGNMSAAPEYRKVPAEQPYNPPARLPAEAPPQRIAAPAAPTYAPVRAAPTVAVPFAKGESPSHILSELSSANMPPKPVAKPVTRQAVRAPVSPAPKQMAAQQPIQAPKPVAEAKQPVNQAPKPINSAPMMVPVKKSPPPLPETSSVTHTAAKQVDVAPAAAPKPVPMPEVAAPKPIVSPPPITDAMPQIAAPETAPAAEAAAPVIAKQPNVAPQPEPVEKLPTVAAIKPPSPAPISAPQPAPKDKEAAPPPLPKLASVTTPAAPSRNVPPAPSLDGLDFTNMKSSDPLDAPIGDGLDQLTPQKLLGKPVETMVVNKATTIPEVEVPAAPAPNSLPPAKAPMLPSITSRMNTLFTKDDVKVGVLKDNTRIINPSADAQKSQQKESVPLPPPPPKPAEKKAIAADVLVKPAVKTEDKALPSLDALTNPVKQPSPKPVTGAAVKNELPELPPLPVPNENPLAIKPLEPVRPKPDIKNDTVIASLPALPGIKENKPKTAPALAPALPVLPPPDAIIKKPDDAKQEAPAIKKPVATEKPKESSAPAKPVSSEKMPPKTLPEPSLPEAKPAANLGTKEATIGFDADSSDLSADAKMDLSQLAKTVKSNKSSVRIVAYAKGTPDEASVARRISLSRALAVRAFLIREGVDQLRINVQAMGHNVPSGNADRADVLVR